MIAIGRHWLPLIANHEVRTAGPVAAPSPAVSNPCSRLRLLRRRQDCDGRRRLCLMRMAGDAASGTLRQEAVWVLRVDDGPDGPFELQVRVRAACERRPRVREGP